MIFHYSDSSSLQSVMAYASGTLCIYHGSARGCQYGNNCTYSHSNPDSVPICQYYKLFNCAFGNECRFRHPLRTQDTYTPRQNPPQFWKIQKDAEYFQNTLIWTMNCAIKGKEEIISNAVNIGNIRFYFKYSDFNAWLATLDVHCDLSETQNISQIKVLYHCEGKSNRLSLFRETALTKVFKYPSERCHHSYMSINAHFAPIFRADFRILDIYNMNHQKIPVNEWKTLLNLDGKRSIKTNYFQNLTLIIPSYLRRNAPSIIPNPIMFLILDYLNDFKHTLTLSVNTNQLNQIYSMKFKEFITSSVHRCGDLNFNIRLYPNGGVHESFYGIYLEIWSMALAQKISAIKVHFSLRSKGLSHESDREYCFQLPYDGDTAISDKAISSLRLLSLKGLTIECKFKILEIYDIEKRSVDQKYWNWYLNIGYDDVFNDRRQRKEGRMIRIRNLKKEESVHLNGRIGKVMDCVSPFPKYQYIVRLISDACAKRLEVAEDRELLIYDQIIRLGSNKVLDY